jgi:acyl carrier protein
MMSQALPDGEIALLHQLLTEIGAEVGDQTELPERPLSELNLDSLSLLELLMLVDEHTGVEIPVEAVDSETTISALAGMINRQRTA